MGGVPDNHAEVFVVVRGALINEGTRLSHRKKGKKKKCLEIHLDGHEGTHGVLEVIIHQVFLAHDRDGVRELLLKEGHDLIRGLDLIKLLKGHKERASEGLVFVREGDHHEGVPRPNVQVLVVHAVLTLGSWADRELFVSVANVFL